MMERVRIIVFLTVIVLVVILSGVMINRDYSSMIEKQQKQQKNEFTVAVNEFEANMNNSMVFVYGLSGFTYSQIKEKLTSEDFEEFARKTQESVPYIRNFSIALDYVQTYVYPLKGNESTLGHNLLEDSREEVVNDVIEAVTLNRIVISGPYELRQGGLGMVVRSPIYYDGEPKGLVNVVIDVQSVIDNSEISKSQNLSFQLGNIDGQFWGEIITANLTKEIVVGDDIWNVGVLIDHRLSTDNKKLFIRNSFIVLSFGTLFIAFLMSLNKRNSTLSVENHSLIYDDILTGVPNRRALEEEMIKLIEEGDNFSIAFLDLDNFKDINDTLGHSYGDEVLRTVAGRISSYGNISCFRWGGDEFVLIGVMDLKSFERVILKIQKLVSEPITLQDESYVLTSSIGICSYPNDAKSREDLIKLADTTMYYVKNRGKNSQQIYCTDIGLTILEDMKIERLIESSLADDLLELYYQPQFSLNNHKVYGFEALLRMKDKDSVYVTPDRFIPIAERSHLIYQVDEYVVDRALSDLNEWNKQGYDFGVSINISAKHFSDSFAEYIYTKIKAYNINPLKLEVEITESVAIENFESAKKFLIKLSKMGVHVALDDFGTGFSSLSYISKLHLSALKIDKSFIDKMSRDNDAYSIIKYVIKIVKALKITSIAEGVETEDQLNLLKELNCDAYQGYFLSRPLPKDKVIDFLLYRS